MWDPQHFTTLLASWPAAGIIVTIIFNNEFWAHFLARVYEEVKQVLGLVTQQRHNDNSAELVPTFPDGVCHVISVTDPYARILGFPD
jgi:hypothetical protein